MGELQIEWDDEKNRINYKKHGVRFETAAEVFDDPYRKEFYDEVHSEFEDRFRVIGMVRNILVVIYTERKDALRIISARQATNEERMIYYDR